MNLPTLAVLLDTFKLSSISGASKVIDLVNNQITDVDKHIDSSMTGDDLNIIYKQLDYHTQNNLTELMLFTQSEAVMIVNQIEILHDANNRSNSLTRTFNESLSAGVLTGVVLIVLTMVILYHLTCKANNAVIESNVFTFIGEAITNISELPQESK